MTEVDIAGDKSRSASAMFLKDIWTTKCRDLGIEFEDTNDPKSLNAAARNIGNSNKMVVAAETSLTKCLMVGNKILKARTGDQSGLIVITGSLHIVSSILSSIHG